jgi:hypothetical protein
MSNQNILYTFKEQTEKKHTVAEAIKIYKALRFDNDLSTDLHPNCELNKAQPADKITVVEMNRLVQEATNCFSYNHKVRQ